MPGPAHPRRARTSAPRSAGLAVAPAPGCGRRRGRARPIARLPQRLEVPQGLPEKIQLQHLLADLALQLRHLPARLGQIRHFCAGPRSAAIASASAFGGRPRTERSARGPPRRYASRQRYRISRFTVSSRDSDVPLSPASRRSTALSLNSRLNTRVFLLRIQSSPARELSRLSLSHFRGALHREASRGKEERGPICPGIWPRSSASPPCRVPSCADPWSGSSPLPPRLE